MGRSGPRGQRFSFQAKAGNDLGVAGIVLGATQHRKSEELHLRGIEDTHRQACLVERPDQSLAIHPGSFQPKVDLAQLPAPSAQLR